MKITNRTRKLADLLRQEISSVIQYKIKDPRIGFVSITSVDVAMDLQVAVVYTSVMSELEKEKKDTLNVLKKASGFIRNELFKKIRIKHIPKLVFKLDKSIDYSFQIQALLQEVHQENENNGISPDGEGDN